MKRSEINEALTEMEEFVKNCGFRLPPFCGFTPEEWLGKGKEYDEIRECMLGWDITDYGLGNFGAIGLSLITIRNGNHALRNRYPKTYAEKLLYLRESQLSPMHFHWHKMEDIVNRGGGNVLIRAYNSTPDEALDVESDVRVHIDGRSIDISAGTQVRLKPGESISIFPGMYHDFSVEYGSGPVLLGEVSQLNDDNSDNRFLEDIGRFPDIEEDEPPYRLLCNEYPPPDAAGKSPAPDR